MRDRRATWIILVLISLALTSGCAATQYKYAYWPKEGDGTIVVYRKFASNAGAMSAIVEVDGQDVVGLANNEYAMIRVSPGTHTVAVRVGTRPLEDVRDLTIRENDKVYLEVKPNPARSWTLLMGIPFGPFGQDLMDDTLGVRTFLLRESNKEEFSSMMENFEEKRVDYVR